MPILHTKSTKRHLNDSTAHGYRRGGCIVADYLGLGGICFMLGAVSEIADFLVSDEWKNQGCVPPRNQTW